MITLSDATNTATTKSVVATILRQIPVSHSALLSAWQNSIDLVWDNSTPEALLAEMGTNAVSIFQISNATAQFLETVVPGCCADRIAKVKPCNFNQDGTVTLIIDTETPV